MPITDLLERNSKLYGDEVALVEINPEVQETQRVTWKEYALIQPTSTAPYRREITWSVFDEKANRVANLLLGRGIRKGQKVAILLMNCLEWLPIYFGILKTGAVAVPLNFRYTAEEIGPFWPEDYLNKAVALGLLDGLPADGGAGLTRGDAALLLYRVLRQTDRDGQDYIDNLCASKVTGAVLLDNNAEAADGTLGTVEVYANQTINWYEPAEAVPDRLVGRKGALLLDEAGKTVGFLPDDSSHRTLRPAEVAADGITAAGGGTYAISSGTRVLLDGAVSTYGDCWYELEGREQVTLYYTDSGALDLVVASEAAAYEGVMLTGYYENASPNAASPASITLLGVELEVVDGAAAGLSAFAVGDRITVTLNGAGEVISHADFTKLT